MLSNTLSFVVFTRFDPPTSSRRHLSTPLPSAFPKTELPSALPFTPFAPSFAVHSHGSFEEPHRFCHRCKNPTSASLMFCYSCRPLHAQPLSFDILTKNRGYRGSNYLYIPVRHRHAPTRRAASAPAAESPLAARRSWPGRNRDKRAELLSGSRRTSPRRYLARTFAGCGRRAGTNSTGSAP
jgi:hypothetical protein